MSEQDDLARELVAEVREQLDPLDADLMTLEASPQGPSASAAIARVFRTIHSLKGTCGFLGFARLEALTHVGESLLMLLRDGERVPTPARVDALLQLVDAVRGFLDRIEATGGEGEEGCDALRSRLEALAELDPAVDARAAGAADAASLDADTPAPPTVAASTGAGAAPAPAITPASVDADPGDALPTPVTETTPADRASPPPPSAPPAVAEDGATPLAAARSTIRVDVQLLDTLMNLVSELVLARNQILQNTDRHEKQALTAASQRLNLITTELQAGVMQTRMQPIDQVWSHLPRVVRDIARSRGKLVRVVMEGRETELDKTIIEAIKDPLTHIVRNAVDHGIEDAFDRDVAGKPSSGTLRLRAFHDGGQVIVEVTDDGAGIDLARVREKAVARLGRRPAEVARMSDRELLQLVFEPGFSTAEAVTNVSGRGVGMDVVRTNIERIGGTVDLQSTPGEGTEVRFKIPLTLAIIPALLVNCGAHRFAVPQASLLELVLLDLSDPAAFERVAGAPVYRLRGALLPLVSLAAVLGLEHDDPLAGGTREGVAHIVVVQADEQRFGLVVNDVLDTQEIVVKPLSHHLKGLGCYAGATIMGDGEVALILDNLGLAERAGLTSDVQTAAADEQGPAATDARREGFLLLGVADHTVAVRLPDVARLETFSVTSIERTMDGEVVQYRGDILPLARVDARLGLPRKTAAPGPNVRVVVCRSEHGNVGLVVDTILDVVEEHVESRRTTRRPGLAGSAVLQGRVIDLLDLPALFSLAA